MPEEKRVIELRILENDFNVKAGESEEYIREIAAFVNEELSRVKEKNPFTNHIRIAILGCMNITELLFEAKKDVIVAERKQETEVNNINLVKEELATAYTEVNDLKESKLKLVEEKEQIQKEKDEKDELLNQYREHLKQAKVESESNRKAILDLQNQLFESQIELVKAKKSADTILENVEIKDDAKTELKTEEKVEL
ncbi:MAG: cell division protein ZapA [Eubacterium sp.]